MTVWQTQTNVGRSTYANSYGGSHVGEILEAILRALFETLFEVALKGPGYLLVRWFRPKSAINPDGCLVLIVGMAFWLFIGLGVCGLLVLL